MINKLLELEKIVGLPYEDWTPTIFNDILILKHGAEAIELLATEGLVQYILKDSGRVNGSLEPYLNGIHYNFLRTKALVDVLGIQDIKNLTEETLVEMGNKKFEEIDGRYQELEFEHPIEKAFAYLSTVVYAEEETDVDQDEFKEIILDAVRFIEDVHILDEDHNINTPMFTLMIQLYETIYTVNEGLYNLFEVEYVDEEIQEALIHIEREISTLNELGLFTNEEEDENE